MKTFKITAAGVKNVKNSVMTLKAACAALTSELQAEVKLPQGKDKEDITATNAEVLAQWGWKGTGQLTPNAVLALWHKDMRIDGKAAMWVRVPFTYEAHVEADEGTQLKRVYTWDKDKEKHVGLFNWQLREVTSWSTAAIIDGLRFSHDYDNYVKPILAHEEALAARVEEECKKDIKRTTGTLYVTDSPVSSRMSVHTKLHAVKWSDVNFHFMEKEEAAADVKEAAAEGARKMA